MALDLLTAANDLLATGAQQATLSVELCHYTVDECLSNTSVLDLTDLQDLGLEGTCLTDALDDAVSACPSILHRYRAAHRRWNLHGDGKTRFRLRPLSFGDLGDGLLWGLRRSLCITAGKGC